MGLYCYITYTDITFYTGGTDRYKYAKIYANIMDDNGNPANGNNATIEYRVYENGVTTTEQAIAAGQSVLLYYGTIEIASDDGSGNYTPYYTKDIGFGRIVTDAPPTAPPVNTCDVYITNINIDKPESSPGAADAQITVHATSSYLPLQYSLDNVTFQTSNVFTGISGGAKTLYVIDTNTIGCVASLSVNIPVLSRLLIKDPSVTVNSNTSRWSAAFNPVVFTYQRKDFEVISVSLDSESGNAKLLINGNLNGMVNGDLVYIDAGPYKGTYEAKPSTTVNNTLVINTPFTTTATGFININRLRPYYKLLTRITYLDHLTGQEKTIRSTNRPNNAGVVKADISNFLQSLVRVKDESDYTKINFRDDNLSASYRIAYAESWDIDNTEHTSDWVEIADTYYVLYAAKQLGERYGGNLAAYVPFANGTPPARWICDFDEPAYSNHYPFDIGFIYSEHLLGLNLYCELVMLDVNRNPLPGGPQTSYLLNEDGSWLLMNDSSKFIIGDQTVINAPLAEHLGLNRLLVNNNFPAEAYYFTIAIKYDEGEITRTLTQTQTIRIDRAGDDQSVYLRWIGLSGSWNYYRFVYNQEISLDVQNATIIKNYVSDWENQDSIEDVISKTAGQKIKVMAEDLSVNDIKGLQSIKYSPKVQMLINSNPVKWQTVVLNTATFSEYETRNGQAPFSVTFNLPAINIQTQ